MRISGFTIELLFCVLLAGCVSTYEDQIHKLSQAYVANKISKAEYHSQLLAIRQKRAKQQEVLKALGEGLQAFGKEYEQAYNSAPDLSSQAYNHYVRNHPQPYLIPNAGFSRHTPMGGQNASLFVKDEFTRNQEDYRRGFREGWQSIMGDGSPVNSIPSPPATPSIAAGDNYYRKGLKDGMARAKTRTIRPY